MTNEERTRLEKIKKDREWLIKKKAYEDKDKDWLISTLESVESREEWAAAYQRRHRRRALEDARYYSRDWHRLSEIAWEMTAERDKLAQRVKALETAVAVSVSPGGEAICQGMGILGTVEKE